MRGLLNVQYAVKDDELFVIEANPRASRTVPFVSKATGVPLAKVASRVMVGATLAELRAEGLLRPPADGGHIAVKEAVLPFNRFPDVDTVLGPEMRSTGEVMGIDRTFGMAFAKSQTAAGNRIPREGTVFFSLADRDKPAGMVAARRFAELGYSFVATAGTAAALEAEGLKVEAVVGKLDRRRRRPRHRRRRAAALGQGATWSSTRRGAGAPGRRRPHPAHRHRPRASRASPPWPPPSPRRPGSSSGSRPRRPSAPSRSTTATASSGSRCMRSTPIEVDLGRHARVAHAAEPRSLTASGTFGHGDEVAKLGEPAPPRRGDGEVDAARTRGRGSRAPRLHMTASGMVNAVGLQGPGVAAWLAHDLPASARGRRARDRVGVGSHGRRLRARDRDARRRATSSRSR